MVFRRIGKALRDKTAEKICRGLCAIGVPATLAEGAPLEENLESGHPGLRQFLPHRESLGLIDTAEWPIRWVNIVGISGTIGLSDQTPYGYYVIEYGAPDSRDMPEVSLSPVFARRFRAFGRVTGVTWHGKDSGLGIIDRLNGDDSTKGALRTSKGIRGGLSIRAVPEHRCWVIAETWGESLGLGLSPPAPSAELWSCYQAIARHLLAEWKGHKN